MADAVADRALPHNLDAEQSILGAILLHNDIVNQAAELIDAADFFRDAHRRIFDAMVALVEQRQAIDFVTLKEELGRRGDLEEVGGPAYIASLVDAFPRTTNIEHYARIVKQKAALRKLIYASSQIAARAYEADEDAEVLLDDAERLIFSIAEDKIRAGFVHIGAIARESFATIERMYERNEVITGVPSGFVDLDMLTGGFQPADLVIVAARPSVGKTSFVLNIADHVGTKMARTVAIFSLEMSKDQLLWRMLGSRASIDVQRLRNIRLGEHDWGKLAGALGVLSDARVYIDDSPGLGVLEMRAKARRLMAEHGLDLMIVDYIQLMQGRGRFENRTLELASISRSIKNLAKELNVPILVLSQLSRAPEGRRDHRPLLSDLRESGALEQDADVVLFLYREELYSPKPENENLAEVIVAKQRNGPVGTLNLAFLKRFTRFENLEWKRG